MESIDLNLEHYTQPELEQLFRLPQGYTHADLKKNSEIMVQQMYQVPSSPELQLKVFQFLQRAREQLVSYMIPTPTQSFVYTNPSEFYQGAVNPVEKRIVTKIVCLDSFLRTFYKTTLATDCTFTFEPLKKVVSMKVSRITIQPSLAFTAAAGTNVFTVTTLVGTHTIVIPDGNYDAVSMMDCLNEQLPSGMTCTIDANTMKCTFQYTIEFTLQWPSPLGRLFGFVDAEYSKQAAYTSEGIYDPLDKYYFVDVDDFQNNFVTNTVISNIPEGYIGKNIIAKVALNSPDLDFCTREYFGPVKLDKLKIRIINRFGNTVQLNGFDYSISFEFKEWYI
jgi:hypothetical protein